MSAGVVPLDEEELAAQQAAADAPDEPAAPEPAELTVPVDSEPAPAPDAPDLMPPEAAVLDAPAAVPAAVVPDPAALVGKGGSTIKRPIITPQETAATAAISDIARQKIAANVQKGAAAVKEAEIKGTDLEKQAAIEQAHQAERERLAAEHAQRIADATAKLNAKIEANDGLKLHDYFSTERGGNIVLSAILGAVGGFNQSYNGGRNLGLEAVQRKVDQDFQIQRDNIDREYRKEVRLRGDVESATKLRNQALADLDVKKISALKAAGLEAAAQLQRNNVPAAQANTNAITAGLNEEANKLLLATLQKQHGEITNTYKAGKGKGGGGGGGKPGALSELAKMAQRNAPQDEIIAKAEELGIGKGQKNPTAVIMATVTGLLKEPEKMATFEVRDEEGNTLGIANNATAARAANKEIAAADAYKKALLAYKDHIERYGRILNPLSEQWGMRNSLSGDIQSRGRPFQGLQASNTAIELEHKITGGAGVGIDRMSSPEMIDRLINEVDHIKQSRINIAVRKIRPAGQEMAPPADNPSGGAEPRKPAEGKPEPAKPAELTTTQRARLVTIRDDTSKPAEVRARARALLKAK